MKKKIKSWRAGLFSYPKKKLNCFVQLLTRHFVLVFMKIHSTIIICMSSSFSFWQCGKTKLCSAGFIAGSSSVSSWCWGIISFYFFYELEFCVLGNRKKKLSHLWMKIYAKKVAGKFLKLKVIFYWKKIPWYQKISVLFW